MLDVLDDGGGIENGPIETLPTEENETDESDQPLGGPDSYASPEPGTVGAIEDLDVAVVVSRITIISRIRRTPFCNQPLTRTWSRGISRPMQCERPKRPRTTVL